MASRNIILQKEMMSTIVGIITFVPLLAALLITAKRKGWKGVKSLLGKAFDLKRITKKVWLIPALLLLPLIFILTLGFLYVMGQPIPAAMFPVKALPFVFVIFFVMALGEEVGWMGFAYQPMQTRWSSFNATLILGLFWAIWHIPFYVSMMLSPIFIIAQCFGLLGIRFLLVWIFDNAGKSVFAAILFHAVYNVSNGVIPNYNVHPPIGVIITTIPILLIAIIISLSKKAER
jgi:membrane protease YdiL (CAAX protease family)